MKNDVTIHQNICATGVENFASGRAAAESLVWRHFFKISSLVKTAHRFCQSKFLNENLRNNDNRVS
ncbi:hypothetical protein MX551_003669 [Salmonella enterica]|nr:hypothetical protein [Salmonella enterica]EJC1135197.1 hypothetical protein [Salmonella enterica]EJC1458619.1 hypothetical protein [Salmonella enterica]EKP2171069.1 hypothetical protein [Salmonella enterica]EKP2175876.1 hypothetical protein [Salmonella enterica]